MNYLKPPETAAFFLAPTSAPFRMTSGDLLPLPAPAEQTQYAEAGGEEREGARERSFTNGSNIIECDRLKLSGVEVSNDRSVLQPHFIESAPRKSNILRAACRNAAVAVYC